MLEPPWETPSAVFSFSGQGSVDRHGSGRGCNPRVLAPTRFDSERSHEEKKTMTKKLKRMATSSSMGSWQKGYAPDF